MKYLLVVMICLNGLMVFSQSNSDYFIKMAADAGIKRPVPQVFASQSVKRPIMMDSLSLIQFHRVYVNTMVAGTSLWVGGTLLVLTHVLISVVNPRFNFAAVATLAAVGVTAWTVGGVVLPIGSWERHRYKKTLRIELAKRGL